MSSETKSFLIIGVLAFAVVILILLIQPTAPTPSQHSRPKAQLPVGVQWGRFTKTSGCQSLAHYRIPVLLGTSFRKNTREVLCDPSFRTSLPDLIHAVKAQGLEGLVAKRKNSRYESGQRSGAWQKMRVNLGQEFVVGGYTRAPRAFDALVFGYYQPGKLLYAARTRNGFTPASRDELFKRFKGLETPKCPLVNLPETRSGAVGDYRLLWITSV
jgi:hypothetical protein